MKPSPVSHLSRDPFVYLTSSHLSFAGERPFKCESCNYLAANQHEVTRHARQVHNGPKPLSCPYCEYKTADRSNYKKHVELHLNPRQFLCPLCKYAASKKCNLQYHIKSRHTGCNVDMDISKVKLRVKKPDSSEERTNRGDTSSNAPQDVDEDNGDTEEGTDSSPINLSIRKSARSIGGQPPASEAPEKVQKKVATASERFPKEPEKKVTTRQKKMEKVNGNLQEKETQTENPDCKTKRRVKKLPAEKRSIPEPAREPEPIRNPTPESDLQRPEKERDMRTRDEKELHKNSSSGKKEIKSVNKPRRSGSKRYEQTTEHKEDTLQKSNHPEKDPQEKAVKEKASKRKASDALDLSRKSSSETRSKSRRLKATPSEDTSPPTLRSSGTTHAKQKKTRNTSKKVPDLQQTVDPVTEVYPLTTSSPTDAPGGPAPTEPSSGTMDTDTNTNPTQRNETDPTSPAGLGGTVDLPAGPCSPMGPEEAVDGSPESMEVSSSGEDTPPSDEKISTPTFIKPTSVPSPTLPGPRNKPADPEDDEGIHSSHEGGSDISDSASEGSDDSGLNSTGAGSAKMANDPETPTEEIPTPTELKSHMCIFCDRTFPLEAQYRRHLNRHLVNVYYLDHLGQK